MNYDYQKIYDKYILLDKNKSETARQLGISRTTVKKAVKVIESGESCLKTEIKKYFKSKKENASNPSCISPCDTNEFYVDVDENESEEELYKKYNLNPAQWKLLQISFNEWTTPFKNEENEVVPFVNKQKKVLFKKIVPDITLDIIKEQYELMGNKNKYAPIIRKNDSKKKPVMYEIALFDMHLGKLAYSAETGESYDLKIAEELYMNAIYDLLAKARHLNIEKILFPVGQDLINSDGMIPETTAGTRQDNDSRYTKIYTTVSRILVSTIDMLRKCADVDIVIVPSNHDYASMFYIGEFLSAWYRNDKHVDVNNAPTQRKYYRYGKTLIGFTHGDQEKHDKLPLLMAREAQEDWAKVDFMQWHIGHLHKRRVTKYTDGDTFNGVEVRVLPSLSASDFWHTQKGYVKGNRMATGFVFDKEEGCVAEFLSKYIKDKK
jgi:hypothetical protein